MDIKANFKLYIFYHNKKCKKPPKNKQKCKKIYSIPPSCFCVIIAYILNSIYVINTLYVEYNTLNTIKKEKSSYIYPHI